MNTMLQISNILQEKGDDSILVIKKDQNNNFSITSSIENTTSETLVNLKEIFGESRLSRACRKPEININLDDPTIIPTKSVIRKIFVGLLDQQLSDLQNGDSIYVPKSEEELETVLMGCCPKKEMFVYDRAQSSGKGYKGLIEKIYVRMLHHCAVMKETNSEMAELREAEFLTSRLADREMKEGDLIHLNDGIYYVDRVFVGGGAYVSLLKHVNNEGTPKMICRGTAMRSSATDGLKTGINDVLVEIGTLGVKTIWPELALYLKGSQIESLEVLGKSLGGAHAQELAILVEGVANVVVKKLTTVCSVGVGRRINELFEQHVLNNRITPFEIKVIRNGGDSDDSVDYIPLVGGVHLGYGLQNTKCQIEVCYISPEKKQGIEMISTQQPWYSLIARFILSFPKAHCRQSTLDDFVWKKVANDQLDFHLSTSNTLERIRLCFAIVIHVFTLFILNGSSFTTFFRRNAKSKPVLMEASA